jgi:hypothetical protein
VNSWLWIFGAVLLTAGGLIYRSRLQAARARELLSDDMIRQIEERGSLHVDSPEPLDHERIRLEEDRFWEEAAWDEPEEL